MDGDRIAMICDELLTRHRVPANLVDPIVAWLSHQQRPCAWPRAYRHYDRHAFRNGLCVHCGRPQQDEARPCQS